MGCCCLRQGTGHAYSDGRGGVAVDQGGQGRGGARAGPQEAGYYGGVGEVPVNR